MIITYNPIYTEITEYPTTFIKFLQKNYPAYLEEDLHTFKKKCPNIPVSEYNSYIVDGGKVIILSGFLKSILYKYATDITTINSSVSKYKCTNTEVNEILYEHQKKIVKESLKNNRGVIKSPTGSGKSFCICELALKYIEDGLNVLITVPTIALLAQMEGDVIKYCELINKEAPKIGKIGGGHNKSQQLTIGIPQSLYKDKHHNYLNTVNALIADEVHTCATPTYAVINNQLINAQVKLGLSATVMPSGPNAIFITGFFGDFICNITEKDMIDNKVILQPLFKFYIAPKAYVPKPIERNADRINELSNNSRYKTLSDTYNYVISNNKGRNTLIVNHAVDILTDNKGPLILIVNKIKGKGCHGELLKGLLSKRGYDVPIIGGHLKKQEQIDIINGLKDCSIQCCIAGPKILSTGVNIPSLNTVILCGAGKSDNEYIQRVGRLLRKKEGKTRPTVIDFKDTQYWFSNQSRVRIDVAESVYGSESVQIEMKQKL